MKVFLSGIAGTGMSSLAGLFCEKGYTVLGSDNHFYPPVDAILGKMPAKLFEGFDSRNIPADVDFCVIGNVISRGNPEAEFILDRGIPFYSMADALYRFFIQGNQSIVVAGTHGKTTIAAFLAHLLTAADRDPGFFIGGKPLDFDGNYRIGGGDFVIEGDEYETAFFDRSAKFLKYFPRLLVLTAVEFDHVDFYPDTAQYLRAFTNLVNQVPAGGVIVSCYDHEMNRQAVEGAHCPVRSYGETGGGCLINQIHASQDGGYTFTLSENGRDMEFSTMLMGRHNVLNLTAGILMGMHLGISNPVLREAVNSFSGVARRLRVLNRRGKILFLEDFAHHPTSIRSTLESLRETYPRHRLVAVFEPRSWSLRRKIFQDRLGPALAHADEVIIKDIYQKEKIPTSERLDVAVLKGELEGRAVPVEVCADIAEIKNLISSMDTGWDRVVVLLSNGEFGGLPAYVSTL